MSLVIVGSAPGWSADINEVKNIVNEYEVMAIGVDCPYQGEIKYFATYHYNDIQRYKLKRNKNLLDDKYLIINHKQKMGVDIVEDYKPPSGSSALLGVTAAISLGYKKIILCGCPLQGAIKRLGTRSYEEFQKGWVARHSEVAPYVRSMSGWTKEILGEPTKEWINGI